MSLTKSVVLLVAPPAVLIAALSAEPAPRAQTAPLALPQEKHLANIVQLTNGGENAEAYFSFDGKRLSFQSTLNNACDRIYTMNIDGTDKRMVSNGQGRTTCSFFYPDGKSILYASTHLG